ncbi:recombinase family protein, partial [Falsiroseomonas sp. E2-1-a20]|uniref:recombinase family protein n=1 Tax=Falsiroseomonas sp. E2-1-a20 TaxID=3239300 RepID=UPI003F3D1CA1
MVDNGRGRVGFTYTRPSAASPLDAAEQERRIRLAAEATGLTCGVAFREGVMSTRQRRVSLPVRSALLRRLTDEGGTVLVADLAVLARSLPDLVTALAKAEASGATVLLADESGAARSVTASDLEAARRAYVREAVAEGRAKARARGVRFGRPRTSATKAQAVRDAIARGLGVRAAARVGGRGCRNRIAHPGQRASDGRVVRCRVGRDVPSQRASLPSTRSARTGGV